MRYKSPSRCGWPIMSEPVSDSERRFPILARAGRRYGLWAVVGLVALLAVPAGLVGASPVSTAIPAAPSPVAPSSASATVHVHGAASPLLGGVFGSPLSVATGAKSPFAFVPPSPGALSSAASRLALAGPTANTLLPNSSCTENAGLARAGTSGNVLIASAFSLLPLFNATGGVPCNTAAISGFFYTHGTSSVFRSTDGGGTWTSNGIPGNVTHWQNSSDGAYGSISWSGWLLNTLQPSPIIESPSLSAAGNFGLYATTYAPSCFLTGLSNCNSSLGLYGPVGIGVSASTDAGLTWAPQVQISAHPEVQYLVPSSTCQSQGWTVGPYFGNITEMPGVVASPASGHGAVVWDVVELDWSNTTCSFNVLATVFESHTANYGLTWSSPTVISNNGSEYPWITVGPAPTYKLTVTYADFYNATSTTSAIGFTQSTNNGTSWSVEKDTSTSGTMNYAGRTVLPDGFQAQTNARIVADNWTSSPYSGSIYATWTDNQTGTYAGYPGIGFERSGNGGSSWTPAKIIANGTSQTTYYDPTVAVQPDGTVWVTFLSIDQFTGDVQTMLTFSTDGGVTFGAVYPIASAAGSPGSSLAQFTDYNGIVGTSQGASAVWSDCRGGICTGSYAPALYFGSASGVKITTNLSLNATISITTMGHTVTATTPTAAAFVYNAAVTLTAPAYFDVNSSYVATFVSYSGIVSGSSSTITFTYTGGSSLVLNYVVSKAGFVAGTFSPNLASSALTIGGFPVQLVAYNATALQFNATVPSGQSFTLVASAQKYQTQSFAVQATAGQTTVEHIRLNRSIGWIAGRLDTNPPNGTASLLINGTVLASATGAFNISVPWGSYWLNATGAGLTGFSHYTTVNPGLTTQVTVTLSGGLIEGVVTPARTGLVVTIDTLPVTNVSSGTFFYPAFGGSHTIVATQPGYNLTTVSVLVTPGASAFVNLSLTNQGNVAGLVLPAEVLSTVHVLIVNGTHGGYATVSTSTGVFNKSVPAGFNYTVNLTAPGYDSFQTYAMVSAGNTTAVGSITLTKTACTSNCTPPNNNTPTGAGGGIPFTTVIIIVVVVVLAAVIAAVLLLRRRGGGAGSMAASSGGQEELYGDTGGSVPRMRPDGSMDSGTPPPSPPPE